MANVTHLKHLEHLEDEMLNYGVDGCKSIVSFLQELRKMLGCDNSTGFMQTKWDGIPSIVCGIDPQIGQFFIANKSAFNKEIPKVAFTPKAVDKYYGHAPDLADRLKLCLKHLKKLDIKGVVQGDFIATRGDIKTETIHGERLYTFGNQALTYAIPVDHPIGRTIIEAEIIVVLHTHYTGSSIQTMQARAGLGEKIKTVKEVAVIDNDTPMHKIGLDHNEEVKFDKMVSNIDSNCKICGEFLDELVLLKGTKGDAKWHVSSYLKQCFNDQIKRQKTISNPAQALEDLTNFYHSKVNPAADKLKTPAAQVQKKTLIYDSENYLINNSDKFKAMLQLYKDIQQLKQFVINKLDHLETFKTFVRTENGYKVTGPEGNVLHKEGDMEKLVNLSLIHI